jgi:AcrR family transcriptional regulator
MQLDRRSRKRLATRQAISVAATRLFVERGFDQVTVDEIATAADVGRMTVFNHFPRKEDMFFDRDAEIREVLLEALRRRDPSVAPIETLRLLAHRLVAEESPFVEFSARKRRLRQEWHSGMTRNRGCAQLIPRNSKLPGSWRLKRQIRDISNSQVPGSLC